MRLHSNRVHSIGNCQQSVTDYNEDKFRLKWFMMVNLQWMLTNYVNFSTIKMTNWNNGLK